MILTHFLNYENEFSFFKDNFNLKHDHFNFENYSYFLHLTDYFDNFFYFTRLPSFSDSIVLTVINQLEDLKSFDNLENVKTIYHYSIPNVKLAYPEPFVASASFMHFDLWFTHILIYQYWLWFVFVFIIIFFFVIFVCTLRWCNMRIRPRRETRGVSRSKCGDLITATVPVSWAASIIITESTDAIDYYDGFGTTELVIGIRAYQWGWEYYYPKDIDLNYNVQHNYSTFIGNSLKYHGSSGLNLKTNNLWKFYQNKPQDAIITPAHLLILPVDNFKLLNFLNFNDIGVNPLRETSAFKKIKSFSKTSISELTTPSFLSIKHKNLINASASDTVFNESTNFGLKRQHNLINSSAVLNNYLTLFDLNSISRWTDSHSSNVLFKKTPAVEKGLLFYPHACTLALDYYNNTYLTKVLNNCFFQHYVNNFYMFNNNPDVLFIFNNVGKKKTHYPILKMFNLPTKLFYLKNEKSLQKLFYFNDNTIPETVKIIENSNNYSYFKKNYLPFSVNTVIALSDRTVRNFLPISHNIINNNFSTHLNVLKSYTHFNKNGLGANSFLFNNVDRSDWSDLDVTGKLMSNRLYFDYPHSPIISNNPFFSFFDYDQFRTSLDSNTPLLFQSKEELIPSFLPLIYWNFYWTNTSLDWRLVNVLKYHNLSTIAYLPMFNFYYDYDFKNWQDFYFLEDSYWEFFNSIFSFDEYFSLNKEFYKYDMVSKHDKWFFSMNRVFVYTDKIINKPLYKSSSFFDYSYSNSISADDSLIPPHLLTPSSFPIFSIYNTPLDDAYENFKYLNYFTNTQFKLLLNFNGNFFKPSALTYVFNLFRSDYEDLCWFIDERDGSKKIKSANNFKSLFDAILSLSMKTYLIWDVLNLDLVNEHNCVKSIKYDNRINLRSPIKNAIVTYNAIQKVFKTRFDEGRSNSKLNDFTNSFSKQPYMTSPRPLYEKLIGKNKNFFLKNNFYKNTFNLIFNDFYDLETSLNYYCFDFPFLLALKSDASRYFWFDWFSKWGFYEVQPSSSSKYAIHGAPYSNKVFEFSSQINEVLNETETYILRIQNARRNYLSNWLNTSYMYVRSLSWYKKTPLYALFEKTTHSLLRTQALIDVSNCYWNEIISLKDNNKLFVPSFSGNHSYARTSAYPLTVVHSYYYATNALIDILTRREYLYRQLFFINNKLINLPLNFTNSPSNHLLDEIKSIFLFTDPITLNNEYSRNVYFNSLNFFKFNVLKSQLGLVVAEVLNLKATWDYLLFYFFNEKTDKTLENDSLLFKNQYRPLKKGISNMIRLHATGAIAMPIEIRLQILASSKDVIHSWAVPSAGIKIDCIPGFSSHKVTIFLVSGIFWGQCMEVCGRYHHWMPIVVYFMKRDLFFLWCTHFVFVSGANNFWNINDRQYVDYTKPVSFDKNTWISEFSH